MNLSAVKRVRFGLVQGFLFTVSLFFSAQLIATPLPVDVQIKVDQFIQEMDQKHQLKKEKLARIFNQVNLQPSILAAISRPYEGLPWHRYRALFLTDAHIQQGILFWHKHQQTLERAEKEFGVPAEIIVAIIGVETRYGKYKGKYPVLNALSTLSFQYPPRAKFFRKELEAYLLLTQEEHLDPLEIKGSYAGAIGLPQFIPSSYRAYAVDFDGDGRRDLMHSTADAIGSVANYFKVHGWRTGHPIASPAVITGKAINDLDTGGLKPVFMLNKLAVEGITPEDRSLKNQLVSLIPLDQKSQKEYWIGLQNFYTITRYNHSALYAMAVYQLSQEIRQSYDTTLQAGKKHPHRRS